MKQIIAILFFLFAAATVIFMAIHSGPKPAAAPKVSNFEQCAQAGYPIMESYPRQCTLPNGKFFTEQNIPER